MYLRKYGRPSSTTEEEIHFKPMLAYHFVAKTSYKKAFKSTLTMDDAPYGYYVVNPEGWYMSKKLNGIRGIWYKGIMKSRMALKEHDNRVITIPQWLTDILPPDVILDGELYIGKDRFYELIPMVQGGFTKWDQIQYCLFDCFDEHHSQMPFATRLVRLRQIHEQIVEKWKSIHGSKRPCPVVYHKQHVIESWPRAFEMFKKWVMVEGEEGAILKNGKAPYEQKRSYNMLKWKVQHKRSAVIVGFNMNREKLKSLQCVWTKGAPASSEFSVSGGLNPELRRRYSELFSIGDEINISFYETSMNDKPISAVIMFE
jgi:DNA ligase-1